MISKRFTHFFTRKHVTLLNKVIAFRNLCAELYKNPSRGNLYGLCAINTYFNVGSRPIYNLLSTIGYLGLHEQFNYSLKYTDPTSFLFPSGYRDLIRLLHFVFYLIIQTYFIV